MKSSDSSEIYVPQTLIDAIGFYSDEANCDQVMVAMRWPNGICCPACGSIDVKKISTRWIRVCADCKKQFSTKVGSVFEDSALPLSKWLVAVWLLAGAKNGISSCELSRAIGVTQKTAWHMLHRIREAMATGSFEKFRGTVEADETFIGGLEKNKHAHKRIRKGAGGIPHQGKTIVMGVLERGSNSKTSKVRAMIVQNVNRQELQTEIRASVDEFATVYTDAWQGYRGLSASYIHEFVDHAVMYAIGQIHTNGIENFWTLLKRMLKGTYVAVEPFHLKRYIDELVFRFNNRDGNDGDRFLATLSQISGKRLTYDTLTRSYEAYYQQTIP